METGPEKTGWEESGVSEKDLGSFSEESTYEGDSESVIFRGGGYYRSGGAIYGSYKGLKEYKGSGHSKSNEMLIRGIAEDVAKVLSIDPEFAKTGSIEDVIKNLQEKLPDPKTGKWIESSTDSHEKICKALATSINKRYGSEIVDENSDHKLICHATSEVLSSLVNGLKAELDIVGEDIEKYLKNMKTLRSHVEKIHKKMTDQGTSTIDNFYKKIKIEADRQIVVLENALGIQSKITKDLGEKLETAEDLKKLMGQMKVSLGSDDFSRVLSFVLRGHTDVAEVINKVKHALEEIGMTSEDYQNTKTIGELREQVKSHIAKNRESSKVCKNILDVIEILYENDFDDNNILNLTETKGGMDFDKTQEEIYREDPDDRMHRHTGRTSLQKQIRKQSKKREELFSDFKKLLRDRYQQLVDAVSVVPKKIGSSIPASDELGDFITFYRDLQDPQREDVHLALSGYRKDLSSKTLRTSILSSLKSVSASLEPLKSGASGSDFKAIQNAVHALAKTIDDFGDKYSQQTAIRVSLSKDGGDIVDYLDQAASLEDGGEAVGGALTHMVADYGGQIAENLEDMEHDLDEGSIHVNPGFEGDFATAMGATTGGGVRYPSIKKTQRDLVYYYNIANIRQTLQESAKDLASYKEDYENILGDEIGHMVDLITLRYNKEMESPPSGPKEEVEAWRYVKTR